MTATFNAGGAYGSGYEYPGGSYGTPGGENAGATRALDREMQKRSASQGRRKARAEEDRLVAKRAHNANLGKEILTTKKGRTLYSLSAEGGKNFICTAGCLSIWHP